MEVASQVMPPRRTRSQRVLSYPPPLPASRVPTPIKAGAQEAASFTAAAAAHGDAPAPLSSASSVRLPSPSFPSKEGEKPRLFPVKYGDTLRRFNVCVDGQDIDHDMNKLRTKIINLFKFNANANLVLTYTDIDGDVVTLVDDDELHDAVFRQHLDPLRINVQLKTDSAARADTSPYLETSSRTGTEGTLTPRLSSTIDDALKSVPDPLRSVLSSISHDFMSKAAAAPAFGEFMDYFSKLGHGTTHHSPKTAEFGGVSHVATNPLDHSIDDKPKPLHDPVPQNPSSSNSTAVNQIPEDNTLPPGFDVMTGCTETLFPENWLECSLKIPRKPSVCHGKDKAEGKKVANEETDVKSIASASVPSSDHQPVYQGCYDDTILTTPVVDPPPGVTDILCSDIKTRSTSPFISDFGFKSQKNLPVNKHSSEPALSQIPSGLPQVLHAYGRSHGHHDSMIRTFHKGVRCDVCGVHPIIGPRFKSNVKVDFDLCSICFSEVGNESDYTRIDRAPYRSPRFLKEFNPHSRFHAPPGCRGYGLRPHKGKLESRFIQDITILDGTLMAPSTPFTKIWRMRNNGTLVWPSGTQLVWIGGDRFAERGSVELEIPENGFPVDKEIDIAVDFRAPSRPGRYISYWRMASPSGQKYGQRVWVLIQVDTSRPNSAGGIIYPELNLNLPPEGSEQGGVGSIYVNAESLESVAPSKLDTLGPKDLVQPFVNEIYNPSNGSPPVLASLNETSPPLPEMPPPPPSSSLYPIIDLSQPFIPTSELVVPPPEEASLGGGPAAGENPVEQTLLKELEEMGFRQIDLNKEVLRLNDYDLEQSLNDLCGISEWDPLLEELQEMGFSDKERNKKLLIKNGGSIKRVVLDLIAGERAE
ncbi:hypothetical protein Taro_026028 [Colocasia esculenta]|uniref:ZZ-type domain-containing protein n=1 Tax=Colocasia esculenta TaxID=4460 RepID=A0A843VBU2_COLES|nr:hypothetical protein [Colocasia esculenta]